MANDFLLILPEEIIAVATAATREAENQSVFIERLQQEAGVEPHVLPGQR